MVRIPRLIMSICPTEIISIFPALFPSRDRKTRRTTEDSGMDCCSYRVNHRESGRRKSKFVLLYRIDRVTHTLIQDPSSNPYGLGDGTKYYVLEVEDWTRPGADSSNRRKSVSSKSAAEERATSPNPLERPISPPPAEVPQSGTSAAEPLGATRSPNSHLFPVRTRSNSTSAGPSSLSRLLAQAPTPVETPFEATPTMPSRSRTPSPVSKVSIPNPPSPTRVSQAHSPVISSPLRPGSRASRTSSSRVSFSGGRIAPFVRSTGASSAAPTKASPTTALTSEHSANSNPPSPVSSKSVILERDGNPEQSLTPPPTHSATEGMSSVLFTRRRTTSEYTAPVSSTLSRPYKRDRDAANSSSNTGTSAAGTLANLASTFGMSMTLGRRKRTTAGSRPESRAHEALSSEPADASSSENVSGSDIPSKTSTATGTSSAASQLLKQL